MQQTKVFAKRTFQFPKIAYSSRRRVNLPEVEIELRLLDDNSYELSICGNVWNSTHSDIYNSIINTKLYAKIELGIPKQNIEIPLDFE